MFDSPVHGGGGGDCNTSAFGDFDNDPDSPHVFSMTQHARKLGIDVTWASSPTRPSQAAKQQQQPPPANANDPPQTSTPKFKTKENSVPTPPTGLRRSKSAALKNRPKQLFKASSVHHSDAPTTTTKRGIYKFMEELKTLLPGRSSRWPTSLSPSYHTAASTSASTTTSGTTSTNEQSLPQPNDQSMDVFFDATSNTESIGWTSSCDKIVITDGAAAASNSQTAASVSIVDHLSKSLQDEFLNDSDFDMVLIKTSQDVEKKLLDEQLAEAEKLKPTAQNNLLLDNFLEQDSFDDLFSSKELDQLIAQSQQSPAVVGAGRSRVSLERHKSMPTTTTMSRERFQQQRR